MNRLSMFTKKLSKGFTLIELLIVIAVLGVLAAVVLVAIDPVEQLARGRDAGRKSSVVQLGRALQAYYTNNSAYPAIVGWNTTLLASGDVKVFPTQSTPPTPATACDATGNMLNNFCYKLDSAAPNIVVYTRVESKSEKNKGTCAGVGANTWFVYASIDGRAGIICQVAEPNATTSYTYY